MRMPVFSIAFLLLSFSFVSAGIYFDSECAEKNCIQDTEITYHVNIDNTLNRSIVVDSVHIRELDLKKVIGLYVGRPVELSPSASHTFNITSLVPAPYKGFTIYYSACFEVSTINSSNATLICSDSIKSFTTIPLEEIECRSDDECRGSEYCNTFSLYKCLPLDCPGGKTAKEHRCVCTSPKTELNGKCVYPTAAIAIGIIIIAFIASYIVSKVLPKKKRKVK